ncbi:MAG: hypothetical protein Q9220_007640 [cf. Caloplaca sp. 1 TL-2023]
MSGFLSSEAERALMGEEEEARRLFYSDPLNHPPPPGHPAYHGQRQGHLYQRLRLTEALSKAYQDAVLPLRRVRSCYGWGFLESERPRSS